MKLTNIENFQEELNQETNASKIVEAIGNKNETEKRIVNMQQSAHMGVTAEPVNNAFKRKKH